MGSSARPSKRPPSAANARHASRLTPCARARPLICAIKTRFGSSTCSPSHDAAPAITPNYLSTPGDRRVAAESLRLTRHIVAQPALSRYKPTEFRPGVQFQSDADLTRLAGDIATTIFHPVGTCKMGRDDDPLAVVDTRLRLRGVAGLRIVDASVMPTITSGNTNSPTLMLAERAAQWIRADADAGVLLASNVSAG